MPKPKSAFVFVFHSILQFSNTPFASVLYSLSLFSLTPAGASSTSFVNLLLGHSFVWRVGSRQVLGRLHGRRASFGDTVHDVLRPCSRAGNKHSFHFS